MKTKQLKIEMLALMALAFLTLAYHANAQEKTKAQPNFLVIVADDMGFSDMGAYGGEINTPNLDRLAQEGTRYTNYYVAPTCSPTRAMFMTGMDNHLVGMGNMYERTAPNQIDEPGYEGYLRRDFPTIAEILKENGYHTYMAGKWHLGKSKEHLPRARGFEHSFSMLSGSGDYFSFRGPDDHIEKNHFSEDGKYLEKLPKKYYATTTFTNKIIDYIDSNKGDGRPFFAYLAHQAPHDPLAVPNNWLRKYEGVFDKGWDVLRDERMERMIELGILQEKVELGERLWYVPGFDDLKPLTQTVVARKMEVYAAVLDYMDMEIGRLIKYLEDNNLKDNTHIIFFSDNGPETANKADTYKKYPATNKANWMAKTYTHGYQNWGRKGSYTAYGPSWAQVSAAPFNGVKATVFEGGIRSPLVIVSPNSKERGAINSSALMHVKDIPVTMLELANIDHKKYEMQGKSWVSTIEGSESSPRTNQDYIASELFGNMSVRKGVWKILKMAEPYGNGDWQLYNLENDPGERRDLAKDYPEKVKELALVWDEYASTNNVILPNRSSYDGLKDKLPPRPPVYDDKFPRGSETVPEIDENNK
ncbi:sulfatase-like hydrolase/transferase [Flagellimonas sp.]|uniref:sulfatase-like hydrolase/transferase n=1 Tax=Flagellimonas sp. TaxID=2058762 RepID=UPI003B5106B3